MRAASRPRRAVLWLECLSGSPTGLSDIIPPLRVFGCSHWEERSDSRCGGISHVLWPHFSDYQDS